MAGDGAGRLWPCFYGEFFTARQKDASSKRLSGPRQCQNNGRDCKAEMFSYAVSVRDCARAGLLGAICRAGLATALLGELHSLHEHV
jgi:hypothetical protein